MIQRFIYYVVLLSCSLQAEIKDYIYPHYESKTFSNYGTVGLIQMPSARLQDAGSIGFTWSVMQPYLRGSIVATPFSWMEASYQYTDVNNKLYSEFVEFSGKQSYKDKGIDAKFLLLREKDYTPAIAFGFRDLGGSGLFGAEYVVASKLIGNVDLTAGIGWGILSGNSISNPMKIFSKKFETERVLDSGTGDSQGGEFNVGTFFKGKNAGTFIGAEIFLPRMSGTRFKVEYDGTNYDLEGYEPIPQESKINFSLNYPVTKNLFLKIGYIRGNEINFGFSYSGNYKDRDPFIDKTDYPKPVPNAEAFRLVNSRENINLYASSLKYLSSERLYLQSANVNENTYEITYLHNFHTSQPRAVGRVARILDQISPDNIDSFRITNVNASHAMYTVDISRDDLENIKIKKYQMPYLFHQR